MLRRWGGSYSDRDWGCLRKKRYETAEQAERAAERIKGSVYRCRYCQCWHVTKKKGG